MNFHATLPNDRDDFEFTATYGTAVRLVRAEKTATEVFGVQRSARAAYRLELGDYPVRHPKAA